MALRLGHQPGQLGLRQLRTAVALPAHALGAHVDLPQPIITRRLRFERLAVWFIISSRGIITRLAHVQLLRQQLARRRPGRRHFGRVVARLVLAPPLARTAHGLPALWIITGRRRRRWTFQRRGSQNGNASKVSSQHFKQLYRTLRLLTSVT